MQTDLTRQQIEPLKSTQAVLLLFGGPHCGVCQAIKLKLELLLARRYPEMARVYVDCAGSPDMGAQHGVNPRDNKKPAVLMRYAGFETL